MHLGCRFLHCRALLVSYMIESDKKNLHLHVDRQR